VRNDQENRQGGSSAPLSAPVVAWPSRVIGWLAVAAAAFSAALVLVTLAITGFSVFRRYVLGRPVTWTDELSGFLVVAIVMLGAAEVLRRDEHVSVDIISDTATGAKRWLLSFWSNLSVALVAGILFFSSLDAVQFSRKIGVFSDGYLEAPLWIPQSVMLVGVALLFLMAAARLVDLIFFHRGK
jgi:TRAP-type C4-dicarboxylate transport system permease small subunit